MQVKVENPTTSLSEQKQNNNDNDNSSIGEVGISKVEAPERILEKEYNELLKQVLNILGLSMINIAGLGNYQILSVYLAYFG